MDLIKFVPEELLIVVAALYVLGMFLKNSSKVPDWIIPWVLLIFGIVGSIALSGLSAMAIIQGIICTGVAVLTNQLIKQTINKDPGVDA